MTAHVNTMAWFQSSSWWIILMMGHWSLNPLPMISDDDDKVTRHHGSVFLEGHCRVLFQLYRFITCLISYLWIHNNHIGPQQHHHQKKIIIAQNIFAFQEHVNVKRCLCLWYPIGLRLECARAAQMFYHQVSCVYCTPEHQRELVMMMTTLMVWRWWWHLLFLCEK